MSISTQREVKQIPLSALILSKENMRKGKSIDPEFVHSLQINGVIQALIVSPVNDDSYEVAAGRRRFNGLSKLLSDKVIDENYPVPCIVTDDNDHLKSLSIAENLHRSDPHPTEYYTAIKQLDKDGLPKSDICNKLQIDSSRYDQILRLANLHSKIFKAFSQDILSSEQARAFAATDNKKRQLEVWAESDFSPQIQPRMIRNALVSNINSKSPIAMFVGMDAYKEAKGKVTVDLFGDIESIHDQDLITRLATDKLKAAADTFREQQPDWAWIQPALPDQSLEALEIKNRVMLKQRKQTDAQTQELADIQAQIDAIDETPDEDFTDELELKSEELYEQLHETRDRIRNENQYCLKRDMKYAGVIITIGNDGKLLCKIGMQTKANLKRLKEDGKKAANKASNKSSTDPNSTTSFTTADNQNYSQALKTDFERYRRAITKAELLKDPKYATELMHYSIVLSALNRGYYHDKFHNLSVSTTSDETSREDYQNSKMHLILETAYEKLNLEWLDKDNHVERVEAFICLSRKEKDALLAYSSAVTLEHDLGGQIEKELAINHRDYFTPDAGNYFSRVSKDILLDNLYEITNVKPTDEEIAVPKKRLVAKLAEMFTGKGMNKEWTPPLLRTEQE